MSQLKIVQSLSLLHIASMNTYDAVLVDGKEALRLQGAEDVLMTDLPAISEFMIVLPVLPSIGDTVVSYYEGDLISGTIAVIDDGDFVIQVDDIGLIALARHQFHVTGVVGATDVSGLAPGAQLVSTSEDSANFPFGSKATLSHVSQTRGMPPSTIIMVKNNLGWTWDASTVSFRVFDPTIVNFTFDDEVETIFSASEVEIEEEVDTLTLDATTTIPELNGDGLVFMLTDMEGNPIDWADVPDDVREAVTKVANEIKATAPLSVLEADFEMTTPVAVEGDFELTDVDPVTRDPVHATLKGDFSHILDMLSYVAMEQEQMLQQKAQERNDLMQASADDEMDHKRFVAAGLQEANQHLHEAVKKIALGLNVLARMATRSKDELQFAQFNNVIAILTEGRNALGETSKAHTDIATDINVNDALQANYAELLKSA
ncbi:hypothetical protein HNR26_004776 [Rhizobium rosettiformans]|uniref:Uncharacterized protein n=2 Tax=Rhizobium rosettiformans TaxID=1368430 RepID=A0A4S8PH66_9HYPH|nr:hypothetical protein [Rhizobium rosettiformans]MBB5278674.1 hypothetical protein [Rhizobium rosettiformans]THV29943.1 hypothetical protein FAA86_23060 [Rhizobium rosettiformans W3]